MLKEILKEQEEEFNKIMKPPKFLKDMEGKDCIMCGHPQPNSRGAKLLFNFIQSCNAKIIKAVVEEMIGKKQSNQQVSEYYSGYNTRVQEEIEKAKELEKEVGL